MNSNFNPTSMRKRNNILLFTAAILLAIGCEKVVYFDVDAKDGLLVVNATITPGQDAIASVSLSSDPLEIGYSEDYVEDATINLYRNATLVGEYTNSGYGIYNMLDDMHNAQPGDEIKIEVSAPGRQTATATTVIPSIVPITSALITDTTYDVVTYSVIDPDGNISYYDTLVPYYQIEITFTDPVEENHYALYIEYQDAFTYVGACYSTKDPIFGIDNAYVDDNIEEDGESTICEDARFPDLTFNGKEKTIVVEVLTMETTFLTDPKLVIQLSNYNLDYDKYVETSNLQYDTNGDPFSEPVIVYSNIENGFGIFGSVTKGQAIIEL